MTSTTITRLLTLANSLFDVIYYPAECAAWLIEANVFGPNRRDLFDLFQHYVGLRILLFL